MIEVTNASVIFFAGTPLQKNALSDVSFTVNEGEFVSIIGSNGAGKSTLLNLLAGELKVTAGSVSIEGVDVTSEPTHSRARRVARVFQDPRAGTCEAFSIEENMALASGRGHARSFRPVLNAENRDRFQKCLTTLGLGLEKRLADSIGLLSGGQRQAVSLLMATLAPSRVLLLDEHTAALDPKASELVLSLTDKFVGELGLTTMMVTHSMRDAIAHGTRLVMMHQGRIVLDVSGEAKARLSVADILDLFGSKVGGENMESDRMLLG